jgi:hypothetical protein
MFSFLAGVRGEDKPVVAPRGLPDNLAHHTRSDAFYIIDDGFVEKYPDTTDFVTLAKALEYEEKGWSTIHYADGKPRYVTVTDWHSFSWLSTDEFAAVIDAYDAHYLADGRPPDNRYWSIEYRAVLAAMRELEKEGQIARLVFWFDN